MVERTHARPRVGESTPHGAHRDPPESHVTHASDTDRDSQSAARSVSPRVSCRTHTTSPCTAGRIEHRTTAPRGSRARERSRLHTSVGSSHGRHVACQRCHDRHRCLCLPLPPRSRLCTYSRPFTTTPHDSTEFSVHTPRRTKTVNISRTSLLIARSVCPIAHLKQHRAYRDRLWTVAASSVAERTQ